MLKIVGGKHRGRSIATPEGRTTRPTSNRARESLFNILTHASWTRDGTSPLVDARVLDAFAGSGALGIEALSRRRGAHHLPRQRSTAIKLIGENLRKLGETAAAKVIRADAMRRRPAASRATSSSSIPLPLRPGRRRPDGPGRGGMAQAGTTVTVELANDEDLIPPPDSRRSTSGAMVPPRS
jgi:16S rRNA (guanine966-N2)-methyltransferase